MKNILKLLIVLVCLFSCKKEKIEDKSYMVFYQNTKSVVPIEIYLDNEYKCSVFEIYSGTPRSCEQEKGLCKVEVEPNRKYQVIYKMGSFNDTDYISVVPNNCMLILIE